MKNLFYVFLALSIPGISFADGFVCSNGAGDLSVKVYNHTHPTLGTRNAAVLILSNPQLQYGNRTIAKFESENLLENHSSVYVADVDLRYSGSNRAGELIGGTKLGHLDAIHLAVNFSYSSPMPAQTLTPGTLILVKRNGDSIVLPMDCFRYLKN